MTNNSKYFKKIPNLWDGISIILTAFNAKDFISVALHSLINQSLFRKDGNWEILIGIDGCLDTFNYIQKKLQYYPPQVKCYYFNENKGTYIVSNTLVTLAKYTNILRFDADDVANSNMVQLLKEHMMMSNGRKYTNIQFKFLNWFPDTNIKKQYNAFSQGCTFYDRQTFLDYGGYMPWICSADSEMLYRLKDIFKIKKLNVPIFLRRKHNGSLTMKEDTKIGSELRNKLNILLEDNYENKRFKIELTINKNYKKI